MIIFLSYLLEAYRFFLGGRLTCFPETRDGKKSYDAGPQSKEMQSLNRRFGRMHGISSLLNMAGSLATVWYGMVLAERLQ